MSQPSCVFLLTYYDAFLNKHYQQHPTLHTSPYAVQHASLMETAFGDSDFYSKGLALMGWKTTDLIINAPFLNAAWAKEHTSTATDYALTLEQLKTLKPDVIYLHDININPQFIAALRPLCRLLVGQVACSLNQTVPYGTFDILVSSIHGYVDAFRQAGLVSYYQALAFSPRSTEGIPQVPFEQRTVGCSFVGGLDGFNQSTLTMMEQLATKCGMQTWGYGIEHLPKTSPLQATYNGQVWGKDMFAALAASKITINRHRDFAGTSANNMRLYEATGAGALLITEYKDNLADLFEIGKEVVAYRNPEECLSLAQYYLTHLDEAKKIAESGQKRTLTDHTYAKRMADTHYFLTRHLRNQKENPALLKIANLPVQENFVPIEQDGITTPLLSNWKNDGIAIRQRAINVIPFEEMYRGRPLVIFSAISDMVRPLATNNSRILEIGCAAGYAAEVLEYMLHKNISYTGADFSPALIALAKELQPKHTFIEADGANLPFADNSFSVVISGGIVLHVDNVLDHLTETCRVSSDTVILHRTPYISQGSAKLFRKMAYGVEVIERWYEQPKIHAMMHQLGFRLTSSCCLFQETSEMHQFSEVFTKINR